MTTVKRLPAGAMVEGAQLQAPAVRDEGAIRRERIRVSTRRMARVQAIIESNRAAEERRLVADSLVTQGCSAGEAARGVKAQAASTIPATPPAGTVGVIVPRPPPRGAVAPTLSFEAALTAAADRGARGAENHSGARGARWFKILGPRTYDWEKAPCSGLAFGSASSSAASPRLRVSTASPKRQALVSGSAASRFSTDAAASPINTHSPQSALSLAKVWSRVVGVFVGIVHRSFVPGEIGTEGTAKDGNLTAQVDKLTA